MNWGGVSGEKSYSPSDTTVTCKSWIRSKLFRNPHAQPIMSVGWRDQSVLLAFGETMHFPPTFSAAGRRLRRNRLGSRGRTWTPCATTAPRALWRRVRASPSTRIGARTALGPLPGPPGARARARPRGLQASAPLGVRRAPRLAAAAAAGVGAPVRAGRRPGFSAESETWGSRAGSEKEFGGEGVSFRDARRAQPAPADERGRLRCSPPPRARPRPLSAPERRTVPSRRLRPPRACDPARRCSPVCASTHGERASGGLGEPRRSWSIMYQGHMQVRHVHRTGKKSWGLI